MNDESDVSRKSKEVDLESGDVLQDEVTVIGNSKVVSNALEELNRVDVTELSHDESIAYSDAVEGLLYLRESQDESKGDHERAARKIKGLSELVSDLEEESNNDFSDIPGFNND